MDRDRRKCPSGCRPSDDILAQYISRPSRRAQILEVCAFLFLIVPALSMSFFAVRGPSMGMALAGAMTILRDLALVALIAFFLWRNRERPAAVGWTGRRLWLEVLLGLFLFPFVFAGAAAVESLLRAAGLSGLTAVPGFLRVAGAAEIVLAAIMVVVVAFAEEIVFRGYLLLRFRAIPLRPVWAIALSSAIFALGHGYEGTAGAVTVGLMGAAYATVYQWRRSLAAPIVMHFLQDFSGIVLPPLIAAGTGN